MKKTLSIIICSIVILCTLTLPLSAEAPSSVKTYVTLSDSDGKLVLVQEPITVADTDNDGKLTITDALYSAHESKFSGGADAGYATYTSAYGLSLSKLWGVENGGSYGYYVNNASPLSLLDEIDDGDYINAFIYTDLTSWSDTYSYFNVNHVSINQGESVELTLSILQWNTDGILVASPLSGAAITIDEAATAYSTDADGKVNVSFNTAGSFVVSATSSTVTLVPSACKIDVLGVTYTQPETIQANISDTEQDVTGGCGSLLSLSAILPISISAALLFKTKKDHEK